MTPTTAATRLAGRTAACLAAVPLLLALVAPLGGDGPGASRSPVALLRLAASDTGDALGLSPAAGLPLLAVVAALWLLAVLRPEATSACALLAVLGGAGLALAAAVAPQATRGPAAGLLATGLLLVLARACLGARAAAAGPARPALTDPWSPA